MTSGAWQAKRPEEKRQANDGEWYTEEEFWQYYKSSALGGRHYWKKAGWKSAESGPEPSDGTADSAAEPAAAPAEPGASQPGSLPFDGTATPAAEPAAASAEPGASQPGPVPLDALQLALVPVAPSWQDSKFLQETLPQQEAQFAASGRDFRRATTPRQAIDLAYALQSFLPLPASAFVSSDLGRRFSALRTPLAVVAEKVLRVREDNRPHECSWRIDFFCYFPTGEVERHHPGKTRKDDMKPHIMHPGCNLFDASEACSVGVGAALHQRPPRFVASSGAVQPGELLCRRADMVELISNCRHDINMASWTLVTHKLRELGDHDQELDWSYGEHFPWWLWLANTGKIRNVANDGISGVRLSVWNGSKCVVVDSVGGTYRVSEDSNGDPVVCPKPRVYRAP